VAPKHNWQSERGMTAIEYKATLKELGLNIAQAGRYLGISERTSHRYIRSETPVPEAHALLLRALVHTRTKPLVPEWVSDRLVRKA